MDEQPLAGLLGTLKHGKSDAEATEEAAKHKSIDYPKPDGKLSFDRLTNVAFRFTNHEESQPAHLTLKDADVPVAVNLPKYAGPAQRYCPAGVYEFVGEEGKDRASRSTSRTACIAKPAISKTQAKTSHGHVPQGGDGPNYPNM